MHVTLLPRHMASQVVPASQEPEQHEHTKTLDLSLYRKLTIFNHCSSISCSPKYSLTQRLLVLIVLVQLVVVRLIVLVVPSVLQLTGLSLWPLLFSDTLDYSYIA